MDHDPHARTVLREDLLKDSDIRVDTSEQIGTLKGTVTGRADRAKAASIAQHTDGVRRVVRRLTIGPKRKN
jgi:osmotically-inducible protein OsmY